MLGRQLSKELRAKRPGAGAVRAEIGKEKADALVRQALRAWSKELFRAIGDGMAGRPRRKWATVQSVCNDVTVPGIVSKVHRRDKEALEFNVTRCPYAELFRALGEPELGAFLVCETDFDIAAAGAGEVSLERAQTIMRGAPSCTFRYKFAPR